MLPKLFIASVPDVDAGGYDMSSIEEIVFRELPGVIIKSLVKDQTVDSPSICELILSFCTTAKPVCSNDEVFHAALLAFGVNSRYKREWLELQLFGHSSTPPTSNRVLFNNLCNKLSDLSQEINDPESRIPKDGSYHSHQLRFDNFALKLLATIGGDHHNKLDLVVAWRRLVVGCRSEDSNTDVINAPYARNYRLQHTSTIEWFYNFVWVMAELFDPDDPYTGLGRPLSVKLDTDVESIWGAQYWVRRWIHERLSQYNQTFTTMKDIFLDIYRDLFQAYPRRMFQQKWYSFIRAEVKRLLKIE